MKEIAAVLAIALAGPAMAAVVHVPVIILPIIKQPQQPVNQPDPKRTAPINEGKAPVNPSENK